MNVFALPRSGSKLELEESVEGRHHSPVLLDLGPQIADGLVLIRHLFDERTLQQFAKHCTELLSAEANHPQEPAQNSSPPRKRIRTDTDSKAKHGQINQRHQFGAFPHWLDQVTSNLLKFLLESWEQAFSEPVTLAKCHTEKEVLIEKLLHTFFPDECSGVKQNLDCFILNKYRAGEGIKPHVDLLRFGEPVLGLSLLSSCTMEFHAIPQTCLPIEKGMEQKLEPAQGDKIGEVFLSPGDIYLFFGKTRYEVMHSIIPVKSERMSITLRKLARKG
eukprot:g60969.t1